MNNRHPSFPILWLLVVPLILIPHGLKAASSASEDSLPKAATTSPAATSKNTTTYTVKYGGTLSDVARKFHCSVTELKKLNDLTSTRLKRGQVLLIPAMQTKTSAVASLTKSKTSKSNIALHARRAEPVQDFDIPASTFASCPVPVATDDSSTPPSDSEPPVTVATSPKPLPAMTPAPAETYSYYHPIQASPQTAPATQRVPGRFDTSEFTTSPVKPPHPGFFSFFHSAPAEVDWGARFTQAARELGDRGLNYDDDWRPPGESTSWTMDCSNTTRYLYKTTAGILLPRTASDQYYYLHLQNKAWDVPQLANGYADCNYLRQNLRPGDLLFWENTYKPERQPPITHVMVFLGTNARGAWIMAGSQSSRGGEHNRRNGGPDIYVFDPTRPCGGYSTWMGLVHHQGRFCAYGRPLEADKSKLAVAAND